MTRAHQHALVLTLIVCALSSQTVLAKKHDSSHKSAIRTSGGTLSLGTNAYQGLTTLSAGTLLVAPTPYEGLIINSGYQGLIANSGTLTLANLYQGSTTVAGGTVTMGNNVILGPSATTVSNSTQIFAGSGGVLSVELSNSSNYMGTLQINNAVNYSGAMDLMSFQQSAGSMTLSTSSNFVIPSDVIFLSSGTLSVAAPEPTSLGLVALAALTLLRRPSRK